MINHNIRTAILVAACVLAAPALGNDKVTQGMLNAFSSEGQDLGPCPLKYTDVDVDISGFVARVQVTQTFHNPFADKIEAVYVFPLSQEAAVDDMTMTVGDRVIRGLIKERGEARQIYEAAKAAGHVASLLDQERPNIFTQSVANIEPGEQVVITIRYVENLDWQDGIFSFDFPMVVGPRYIPGGPKGHDFSLPDGIDSRPGYVLKPIGLQSLKLDEGTNIDQAGTLHEGQAKALLLNAKPTTLPKRWSQGPWYSFEVTYADGTQESGTFFFGGLGEIQGRYFAYDISAIEGMGTGWSPDTTIVPDASRITPPVTPKGTRAGHDISIWVNINAGFPLLDVESSQHEVEIEYQNEDHTEAHVQLAEGSVIPNKDFVLTFATATDDIGDALLTHTDERGNFFTLILQPPKRVPPEWIVPKEMIFVIDKSGSMNGFPIETAKQAMKMAIQNLNPNDTFNLMTFAGGVGFCFDAPVPNTAANHQKALDYLGSLQGSGGTEMMAAIEACLSDEHDPDRVRVVCFMTDGYVGNDMEIIDAVKRNAGTARVFSFGIGTSVNRFLLDGMAAAGRGAVDYVLNEKQCQGAAERFYDRVSTPVLTDLEIDWGELQVDELLPTRIPDLFSATPVVIKGRYILPGSGAIKLKGQRGQEEFERDILVTLPSSDPADEVVATLWARAKVQDLMNEDLAAIQRGNPTPEIRQAIIDLGLTYRLLTQFTSFVAVEEMTITSDGQPRTVAVPVEMPEGVSYEGVFGEQLQAQLGQASYGLSVPFAGKAAPARRGMTSLRSVSAGVGGIATEGESEPVGADFDIIETITKDDDLTPEQKRQRILDIKLAKELRGLKAKLDKDGNSTEGKVKVRAGVIEVAVLLKDSSDEQIEALKALGLQVILQTKTVKMVIGKINVAKLEELALLDNVIRVDLPSYSDAK